MTAPQQRAGGLDANARGIVVLVAAVLIGLLLLWKTGGDGGATAVTAGATTSTTVDISGVTDGATSTTVAGAKAGSNTTTTGATKPDRAPGEVKVLVLNAEGPTGSAAAASDTIGAAGYVMGSAANAAAGVKADSTAVYYAEGYQAEATAVALVLGRTADVVAALPSPVPGPGADASNVVVVLGNDTSPAGTDASATTTTAG